MPVFYILIILSLIILWFLLSGIYKFLGRYIFKIFEDTKNNLKED